VLLFFENYRNKSTLLIWSATNKHNKAYFMLDYSYELIHFTLASSQNAMFCYSTILFVEGLHKKPGTSHLPVPGYKEFPTKLRSCFQAVNAGTLSRKLHRIARLSGHCWNSVAARLHRLNVLDHLH
jgi:hypothetical protein